MIAIARSMRRVGFAKIQGPSGAVSYTHLDVYKRQLEDEQIARLNAMRDANLAALKRRDEAVAARPPMPDERPSRFDDFEKPR